MILGVVIGQVWGARRVSGLGDEKMLLVSVNGMDGDGSDRAPTGRVIVALDNLGARLGQQVTVAWGSGARAVISAPDNRHILADAAVTRIVEGTSSVPSEREDS